MIGKNVKIVNKITAGKMNRNGVIFILKEFNLVTALIYFQKGCRHMYGMHPHCIGSIYSEYELLLLDTPLEQYRHLPRHGKYALSS